MTIGKEDVKKVAHLARIGIDEQEMLQFTADLAGVFTLVDSMEKIDTSQVEPLAHPMDIVQRLREDEATEENQRDLLQQNAPSTEAGLYLVPQVIE